MKNKRLPKLKEHKSALLQYADRFYIRRFPEKKKERRECLYYTTNYWGRWDETLEAREK